MTSASSEASFAIAVIFASSDPVVCFVPFPYSLYSYNGFKPMFLLLGGGGGVVWGAILHPLYSVVVSSGVMTVTSVGFFVTTTDFTDPGGAGRIPLKLPGEFWRVVSRVAIHAACAGSVAIGAGAVVDVMWVLLFSISPPSPLPPLTRPLVSPWSPPVLYLFRHCCFLIAKLIFMLTKLFLSQ